MTKKRTKEILKIVEPFFDKGLNLQQVAVRTEINAHDIKKALENDIQPDSTEVSGDSQ